MSDQDKDKEEAPDAAENTETETPTESSPALPPTKDAGKPVDQISATIGEVGRWQLQKILIVFLASAPGNADYHLLYHHHLYMELLCSQGYLTFSMRVSSLRSRSSGASKR